MSSAMQRHRRIVSSFLQRRVIFFFNYYFSHFFLQEHQLRLQLDETVGPRAKSRGDSKKNCPPRREWKYQVLLATLQNRPLFEPLVCLISRKNRTSNFGNIFLPFFLSISLLHASTHPLSLVHALVLSFPFFLINRKAIYYYSFSPQFTSRHAKI